MWVDAKHAFLDAFDHRTSNDFFATQNLGSETLCLQAVPAAPTEFLSLLPIGIPRLPMEFSLEESGSHWQGT